MLNSGINGDIKDSHYQNPPLELRTIDNHPALSQRWSSSTNFLEFSIPTPAEIVSDPSVLPKWITRMDTLTSQLQELLHVPHHQFWSILIHSSSAKGMLSSFITGAPRFYSPNYSFYENHQKLWPIYKEIYLLVFRVYMRLAIFKESKEDHITPSTWAQLLRDNQLITMSALGSLSTLYENKDNPVFSKMVGSIMRQDPRLSVELEEEVRSLGEKCVKFGQNMEEIMGNCFNSEMWKENESRFQEYFICILDALYSIYKFVRAYPPAAERLMRTPTFLSGLASSYEKNTRRWGRILSELPDLEGAVNLCRAASLRLYRYVLASPTILVVEAANDKRLDEFFDHFSDAIDDIIFIHDYEKNFPFKVDMQGLLSRGIFVDETRIDYMANAISSCFHLCGEEYSVERIVVDPLYDPHFDRQLLGACSLDVNGVELESLISQVKDILPELPSSYVEAVLKHYGYNSEKTINALLEGSVPGRLEKYKSEEYIKSAICSKPPTPTPKYEDDYKLPIELPGEKFIPPKRPVLTSSRREESRGKGETEEVVDHEIKQLILNFLEKNGSGSDEREHPPTYVDESLLPQFNDSIDYEDEYDDTYDDVGAGLTEPDSLTNPLNVRKSHSLKEEVDYEEEPGEDGKSGLRSFEPFCEDPAIVRARLERKREETNSRRHSHQGQHNHNHNAQGTGAAPSRDVVGRAKGQGQDKDVLYNRKQKGVNKGGGGSYKKRSDFKRKEF